MYALVVATRPPVQSEHDGPRRIADVGVFDLPPRCGRDPATRLELLDRPLPPRHIVHRSSPRTLCYKVPKCTQLIYGLSVVSLSALAIEFVKSCASVDACVALFSLFVLLLSITARSNTGGVTYTDVADTSAPIRGGSGDFTGFGIPAFSGSYVAFDGYGSNSQAGIDVWSQSGGLQRGTDTNGTGFSSFNSPAVDSNGTAAFLAQGNTPGIYSPSFTSDDYIRIIGDGDQLDYKTVSLVQTFPYSAQRQQLRDRCLLHGWFRADLRGDPPWPERAGAFVGVDSGCGRGCRVPAPRLGPPD